MLKHFESVASPGAVPENIAIAVSYIAMLVIFPLDIITGSEISLHILYVFPLILISLHCNRTYLVLVAVSLSIIFQAYTLFTYDDLSVKVKFVITFLILISNTIIVLTARFGRNSFLKYQLLSTSDPLTDLLNRRALESAIEKETDRQKRYGGTFSVALIDLDGFKALNDSMGHQTGDMALKILAYLLRENTRQTDIVARIGGDEFVILMPTAQSADCVSFCQTLCNKIANRMAAASLAITASIGCTTFNQAPEFQSDILETADKAMYAAKAKGKGCVVSI